MSQTTYLKYTQNSPKFGKVLAIFSLMEPLQDAIAAFASEAIESFITLTNHFDVYILSTPPLENPTAASDKFQWLNKYNLDNSSLNQLNRHLQNS